MFSPRPLTQEQQAIKDKLTELYEIFMSGEHGTPEEDEAFNNLGVYIFGE